MGKKDEYIDNIDEMTEDVVEEAEDVIPAEDENAQDDNEILIDDSEDEEETLNRGADKENVFKNRETKERDEKREKIRDIAFKAVIGMIGAAVLVGAVFGLKTTIFKPEDDKAFILDNPDDPLSYTNVAKELDGDVIPIYKFSVQGNYSAFDSENVYSEYTFKFDPSGYFEGHSSTQEDDYGAWDMTSDGDNYFIVVTCTDTEDKYKLEFTDDGIMMLTKDGKTYTLTPKEE